MKIRTKWTWEETGEADEMEIEVGKPCKRCGKSSEGSISDDMLKKTYPLCRECGVAWGFIDAQGNKINVPSSEAGPGHVCQECKQGNRYLRLCGNEWICIQCIVDPKVRPRK